MHDLCSQVANSFIGPEIRDLRNSVSDLSRRVAPPALRPTRFSSVPPAPLNHTSSRPSRPSAQPSPGVSWDIPPQPAAPSPALSYTQVIHDGMSEFALALAANAATIVHYQAGLGGLFTLDALPQHRPGGHALG